jgi:hypothetical protein
VHGRLPEWPKGTVCKTVGSAYVGSNPTPATTRKDGPLAGNSRLCGPFLLCKNPISADEGDEGSSAPARPGRASLVAGGTSGRRRGQGRPCVREAARRGELSVYRGGPARAQRQRREAGHGRGRPAGPSGTGRTAGRLVSAGRRLLAVADALPVTVLAVIAGAGSSPASRGAVAGPTLNPAQTDGAIWRGLCQGPGKSAAFAGRRASRCRPLPRCR